jgi:hypothetical protein
MIPSIFFLSDQTVILVFLSEHPRSVILSPMLTGPPNISIYHGFIIKGCFPRHFNWGVSL